jgi:excisionase family DNA binding protein
MPRNSYYTTFEISQICQVNPTTVQNWVKEGKLKAFVTPGGHRRIQREDLVAFLKEFGMPVPDELSGRPPLVMVVDDEPDVIEMLTSLLQSGEEPVEVVSAQGGVQALLMIGDRKPDLLILDIKMPDMDGFEVCRQLRSGPANRNIKIVAITGDKDPDAKRRIIEAGADLFFSKPLEVMKFRVDALKLIGC